MRNKLEHFVSSLTNQELDSQLAEATSDGSTICACRGEAPEPNAGFCGNCGTEIR